jgi:hypothetical protein
MMIFKGGFVTRQLAILVLLAIPACKRDLATEPVTADTSLRIEAVSPTDLEGTVDVHVSPVPVVVVKSETGRAVAGMKVVFIPSYQSGSADTDFLTNRAVVTDSRGFASPGEWKLGTEAGWHDLEARLVDETHLKSDSDGVVTFHALAKAGSPVALSIGVAYDTVALPGDDMYPPLFRAIDRFGNDVDGIGLTFSVVSGGGSLEKTHDESSRLSHASPGKWTLGPRPGINSIAASSPGLGSVTLNARALDVGAVTRYDMVPESVRLITRGSIALCEDGTFEMVTVEASDAFPGLWFERQLGKYTVTGTALVLRFRTGVTESGTLVDQTLSFLHKKENWGDAPEMWSFFKRPEPAAPVGGRFLSRGQ